MSVEAAIDGWPVELNDTAGIRETKDPLEALGVGRAIAQTRQANLVLWVCDATRVTPANVERWQRQVPAALLVANKSDLLPARRPADTGVLWMTCALTRQGLDELMGEVGRHFVPNPPPPGTAVPFEAEQVRMLQEVLALVDQADVDAAVQRLRPWLP